MSAIRAVVFDLDGTLVDSRRDIANATNHALVASGRAALGDEELYGYIGDGARPLLARAAGLPEQAPAIDLLLEAFLDYYAAHPVDHTTLMAGALDALDALGGRLPLALCTNKPRRTAEPVLQGLGLDRHFRYVFAGGDLAEKKPHPRPLLHLADQLGLGAESLVMVGDGPQDVECGRRAGARTVGVKGGILPLERLIAASPDALLDTLSELPDWIFRRPAGDTPR